VPRGTGEGLLLGCDAGAGAGADPRDLQALSTRSLAEQSRRALASGAVSAAEGIALASGLGLAEEGIRRIALASCLRLAGEGIRWITLALGASSPTEQNLPRASRSCRRACSERLRLSSSDLIRGSGGSGVRRREETTGWGAVEGE
jgi:hypothetical protein